MSSTTIERDTTASPADELFYKGKLLPLHLPPRLQMVEKLLETSNSFDRIGSAFDNFGTPLMTTAAPTPTAMSTPFESCNVSPSESFRMICCAEEYTTCEYSTELLNSAGGRDEEISIDNNKSNYSAKKMVIKQSSMIGSRLKASRAYLKSLFGISGCSDESSTAARKVADEGSAMKYAKAAGKRNTAFGQIQRHTHNKCQTPKDTTAVAAADVGGSGAGGRHRRSFSLALRKHSTKTTNKPSSSSSSSSSSTSSSSSSGSSSFSLRSNRDDQFKYLKRCGSANYSESENSIQGAIAHCKKSHNQQVCGSRSSVSDSRIGVCDEQERLELCRG